MAKPIHVYRISRNYVRCEVWHCSRFWRNRIGTSTLTPNKGLAREERYNLIAKWLNEGFGLNAPSYRAKATSRY